MRRMGHAAKKVLPLAFAVILPMCAPVQAVSRKDKPAQRSPVSEKLGIYSAMRSMSGRMVLNMLCAGKHAEVRELSKKMGRSRGIRTTASKNIMRETSVLASGSQMHRNERKMMVFGSLFQNKKDLLKAYTSERSLVEEYTRMIEKVGFLEISGKVKEMLKKGNCDIVLFLKGLYSCPL